MSGIEATIVSDWELNNTPIEVIAEDNDLDPAAVKAVLLQYSGKYRAADGQDNAVSDNKLQDAELEELTRAYKALTFSDNEHIRERVLRRLIDDKKGRLEPVPAGGPLGAGIQINIGMLQQHLSQVEARFAAVNAKALPVPAREARMLQDAKISTVRAVEEV